MLYRKFNGSTVAKNEKTKDEFLSCFLRFCLKKGPTIACYIYILIGKKFRHGKVEIERKEHITTFAVWSCSVPSEDDI